MKQKSLTSLKSALWKLCREIIGKRYPSKCFTCGRAIEGKNKQLGHFVPSSVGGAALRYNLDNLRFQCYSCNIHKSGNFPTFQDNLISEIGKEKVQEIMRLRHAIIKADTYFYLSKIEEYEKILLNEKR